jgi:hypothetical protein
VVLKQGDETEELVLRTSASPKPPPAPPATTGAPSPGAGQGPQAGQVAGQNIAAPGMPGAPGFAPPGANVQAGFAPPPGAAINPMGQAGVAPGMQNPNQNPNANPAAPAAPDPNQAAARRRRFQNLPQ